MVRQHILQNKYHPSPTPPKNRYLPERDNTYYKDHPFFIRNETKLWRENIYYKSHPISTRNGTNPGETKHITPPPPKLY